MALYNSALGGGTGNDIVLRLDSVASGLPSGTVISIR
jgi:hypothetical protein